MIARIWRGARLMSGRGLSRGQTIKVVLSAYKRLTEAACPMTAKDHDSWLTFVARLRSLKRQVQGALPE